MNRLTIVLLAALSLAFSACTTHLVRVKAYEREAFAYDQMLFSPMDARSTFSEHVFTILEGSRGGSSSFQGGCGCR